MFPASVRWSKWSSGAKVCKVSAVVILHCLSRSLASDVNAASAAVCPSPSLSVAVMVFVWSVAGLDLMLSVDPGSEKAKSSFEGSTKSSHVVRGMKWFVCSLDPALQLPQRSQASSSFSELLWSNCIPEPVSRG